MKIFMYLAAPLLLYIVASHTFTEGTCFGKKIAVIASNDFFRAKKEKNLNDIHTLLLVFQRVRVDVIIRRACPELVFGKRQSNPFICQCAAKLRDGFYCKHYSAKHASLTT